MNHMMETIKKRVSVRSYTPQRVEDEVKQTIKDYAEANRRGPFGNEARFQLVEAAGADVARELKELGTYGAIKEARLFVAGAALKKEKAMEDYGYCMEKIILKATEMGLGACWLAGSFKRSTFGHKIGLQNDEVIPTIMSVGYPSQKRSFSENLVRAVARSAKRKDFGQVFFRGDSRTPLQKEDCGNYSDALESVRLAPSASNMQPWRVIKAADKNVFHFYLKENRFYNNVIKDVKIQNLDLGIAMSHFELVSAESGLKGHWSVNNPNLEAEDWQYIVSWSEQRS